MELRSFMRSQITQGSRDLNKARELKLPVVIDVAQDVTQGRSFKIVERDDIHIKFYCLHEEESK